MQDRLKLAIAAGLLALVSITLGFYLLGTKVQLKAEKSAHALEREAHKLTAEALGTCRANVANLDAAVAAQNEAVRGLQAAAVDRERKAAEAVQRAQAEARRYRKAALDLAKAEPGPDRCESAAALMRETLEAERD